MHIIPIVSTKSEDQLSVIRQKNLKKKIFPSVDELFYFFENDKDGRN